MSTMNSDISMTNESFSFLKGSSKFMNMILNNINSCILMLDKDVRLQAFNDSLKTIFSNKKDEHLLYMRCGEAIGCAYQIEEKKNCGETSRCDNCELREAALISYLTDEIIFKNHITKPFISYTGDKIDKHLQFSTRSFIFDNEKYIVMIIEDITRFIEREKKLSGEY